MDWPGPAWETPHAPRTRGSAGSKGGQVDRSISSIFGPREWKTLQFGPLWVFSSVAGIDDEIDQREYAALSDVVSTAATLRGNLVREVMVSLAANFDQTLDEYGRDERPADVGLAEVARLVDEKGPTQEAQMFKGTLVNLAFRFANTSGGEVGRNSISDDEAAVISLVCDILSTHPEDLERIAAAYQREQIDDRSQHDSRDRAQSLIEQIKARESDIEAYKRHYIHYGDEISTAAVERLEREIEDLKDELVRGDPQAKARRIQDLESDIEAWTHYYANPGDELSRRRLAELRERRDKLVRSY